ncbi:Rhomboid-like protein [Quillaja saponaria]|uniref:Rhomboid-like protein n=1 Tax=Quillaja saponaria TaxID=32244 RepID=A0AAD7Q6H0_QUISA|nr:Rhomboid-like protein [Quillaja saponaria]
MYQIQNQGLITKDASESMFQKAVIITALGCTLSNFGPIDDWTHFGAAFTGVAYGFFTCPTLQLDDTSSGTGQEEAVRLVRQYGLNFCSYNSLSAITKSLSLVIFYDFSGQLDRYILLDCYFQELAELPPRCIDSNLKPG